MVSATRFLSAVAVAATLLAACGGSSAPASPSTSPAASSKPASSAAAAPASPAASKPAASAAAKPSASPTPPLTALEVKQDPKLGKFLADQRGLTLYIFTKDQTGVSNCSGRCAVIWPPAIAAQTLSLPSGTPGKVDLITRQEGTKQLTYNGLPIYFYAPDTKPGDVKGEGVGGTWHVAAVSAG
ncbi:MAG: hypothetical protein KGJ86_08660 [Chloroflexota bacterium]|nr:hypothetical protein [Chloroflexota bacterium]